MEHPEFGFSYELIEPTKGENVAVGAWNGFDHNVVRWKRTENNDQRFAFIPIKGTNKYRILSLREDVGSRKYLAVAPNGNAITWDQTEDDSDLFEIEQIGNKIAIKENTKGEYLDVDWRTGNIQRWCGENGKPKDNQLFELKNPKPVIEINDNERDFINQHPAFFKAFLSYFNSLNIPRQEMYTIQEVLLNISTKQWEMLFEKIPPTDAFSHGIGAALEGKKHTDWFGVEHKKEIYAILQNIGIVVAAVAAFVFIVALIILIIAFMASLIFAETGVVPAIAASLMPIIVLVIVIAGLVIIFDSVFLILILPNMERNDILSLEINKDEFKTNLNTAFNLKLE